MPFSVLGSFATIQVVSPTQVVDVLRITFRTIPSGVVAYANAPYKAILGVQPNDVQGIADVFIGPLADGIERMMGSGEVSGALGVEDTDASQLLVDYIDATVEYTSTDPAKPGPFQQVVRIPVFAFDEPSFYDALVGAKIDGAYQALRALAGD
jgi:hypothetical protein